MGIEWMINGNNGTCFCQSVSLNDCVAEICPKLLESRIDASSADNEGPKLPAKFRMQTAVAPPAPGYSEQAARSWRRGNFKPPLRLVLKGFENPRNGNDHG